MFALVLTVALSAVPSTDAAPHRSARLFAAADAPAAQSTRLLEVSHELEATPSGWPTSAKVVAITGYSLAGAGLIGSLLALASINGGSMVGLMLAFVPAVIGGIGLVAAIAATIVGAMLASQRAGRRESLLNEQRALTLRRPPAVERSASAPLWAWRF